MWKFGTRATTFSEIPCPAARPRSIRAATSRTRKLARSVSESLLWRWPELWRFCLSLDGRHAIHLVATVDFLTPPTSLAAPSWPSTSHISMPAGRRGPRVLHRDHDDEIAVLVVRVHDQQPSPGTEYEPERAPGGAQLRAHARKSLEGSQGVPNSRARIARETMSDDQPLEVFDCGGAERYAGQALALQLIEVDRLACASLCESGLGSLIGARNAVEQGSDIPRLRVRFFDSC